MELTSQITICRAWRKGENWREEDKYVGELCSGVKGRTGPITEPGDDGLGEMLSGTLGSTELISLQMHYTSLG